MLKKIPTGIYQHYEIEGKLTKEDLETIRKQFNRASRLSNWLAFYEAIANQCPDSEDAKNVLESIRRLKEALEIGNFEAVAIEAIHLGIFGTILQTRQHEKPVKTGRKTQEYMANMRRARSESVSKEHDKIIQLFNEISEQYEPHERPSDREIIRTISENMDLKFKTVQSVLYRARKKSAK